MEIFNCQSRAITVMLAKMGIAEANENPEYVLHKMLKFYDALRVFYPQYQAKKQTVEVK